MSYCSEIVRTPSDVDSTTTRAISLARPSAAINDSSSRPENRFKRWSRSWVRTSTVANHIFRMTVALVQQFHRRRERLGVAVEMPGEFTEIAEHLGGERIEGGYAVIHAAGRGAGALDELVHRPHEFADAGRQELFDGAHVLLRAAHHFPQQNVGVA